MLKKWFSSMMVALAIIVVGCEGKIETKATDKKDSKTVAKEAANKHDGWWCDEHGIQEAECSMCSAKVAKACQAKGDWCKDHNRAKSQCFICDPKLKEKFAAEYVAKFGKAPPEPEGQNEEKKSK